MYIYIYIISGLQRLLWSWGCLDLRVVWWTGNFERSYKYNMFYVSTFGGGNTPSEISANLHVVLENYRALIVVAKQN